MFASIVPNNTKESHALVPRGLVLKTMTILPARMETAQTKPDASTLTDISQLEYCPLNFLT